MATNEATDDSINHRMKTANDNTVELWGQNQSVDHAARQVAAALPRSMEGLRHVAAGVFGEDAATVELVFDPPTDAYEATRFDLDGWRMMKVGRHDDGTTIIGLVRDE